MYTDKIMQAYNSYKSLTPLDISDASNKNRVDTWKDVIQYQPDEYARMVKSLCEANSLDEYVSTSYSDFDNLAIVIKTAIDAGFIKINKLGKITTDTNTGLDIKSYSNDFIFSPRSDYNQFPCDSLSADYRANYVISRYPFTDNVNIGLIGDDDFISLRLLQHSNASVLVVEKDERIIEEITKKSNSNRLIVHTADIRDDPQTKSLDTFVTDPPYTIDGAMSFILCGLKMLKEPLERKEFYVILNKTMMGMRLYELFRLLSSENILVESIKEGVSHYLLPNKFDERKRADIFLDKYKISHDALKFSSSSNMYSFKITGPVNISKLEEQINNNRIYEHYE